MWQDFVFLIGSMTSVVFLYPTLRNAASQVPRATSIPSMLIGGAYSFTFLTLGMTFSAFGSFAACSMWSLIAMFRAPDGTTLIDELPISDQRKARIRSRSRLLLGNLPENAALTDGGTDHEQHPDSQSRSSTGDVDVASGSD